MAIALAGRALAGLRQGDHASCAYRSDAVKRMVLARFATDAVARGERVVCAVGAGAESAARSALRESGLDVEALIADTQLEIRTQHDAASEIDPCEGVSRLAEDVVDARNDGFTGLAVTAPVPGRAARAEIDRLVAFEAALSPVVEGGGLLTLCRYDAREWPAEALRRLSSTHPVRIDLGSHGSVVEFGRLTVSELESGELAIGGEIDLAVDRYLWARLQAHADGNGDLVLDVGRVAFIDATGCRVLYRLADSLSFQRRLVLTRPTRPLARALALSGWLDHPRIVIDIDSGSRSGGA
ncbi:MAG TPA: MEDS domain-containing protein [Acidimicrobiales bacterium]|nr:MEDS domain-containing protein [Acidimicrobiales bacterium]